MLRLLHAGFQIARTKIGSPDRREGAKMRRREFIAGLGSAAACVARAQKGFSATVGYLFAGTRDAPLLRAFRKGLSEMGYNEGRNVAFEYHWANNDFGRLPNLAADLVRRRVAVIATVTLSAALAAKAATDSIPIVFLTGGEAVETGPVASLAKPGGLPS
jgi:putative ABC transport system substrate-binding protein